MTGGISGSWWRDIEMHAMFLKGGEKITKRKRGGHQRSEKRPKDSGGKDSCITTPRCDEGHDDGKRR